VYLIGHGSATIAHCSDAGEPAGTAGRPALAVLQGSGLGDIVVVITRFFGGTKLGTGGLVRAYSDSMRLVLETMPLAKKVATTTLMFVVPYALFEQSKLMVHNHDGSIVDQIFGADVTLTVRVINQHLDSFKARMVNLTHGGVDLSRSRNVKTPSCH
jgi:putative IMPACT (imprinted ancient) family translation regulator